MRIFCPSCHWKPDEHSRWRCEPGCGHVWNTFDTFGECPGCGYVWRETECLVCATMSPHHDWYHDDEDIQHYLRRVQAEESAPPESKPPA